MFIYFFHIIISWIKLRFRLLNVLLNYLSSTVIDFVSSMSNFLPWSRSKEKFSYGFDMPLAHLLECSNKQTDVVIIFYFKITCSTCAMMSETRMCWFQCNIQWHTLYTCIHKETINVSSVSHQWHLIFQKWDYKLFTCIVVVSAY